MTQQFRSMMVLRRPAEPRGGSRSSGRGAVLLILGLSALPVIAGLVRMIAMLNGGERPPRFEADPWPAVVHVLSVSVWCVGGAFQFVSAWRRPAGEGGWHRRAGRWLAAAGIVGAASGLWLTVVYPQVDHDGPLLLGARWLAGGAMIAFIVLGVGAIRRRNVAWHRAWMIRAMAIALGAGTQVITHVPYFVWTSWQNETGRTVCMIAGWAINLAIAEVIIARRWPRTEAVYGAARARATA